MPGAIDLLSDILRPSLRSEDFEMEKMIRELRVLFKQHNLREKMKAEAMLELIKAKECLEQLEMDSTSLQTLTSYSTI